MSFSAFFGFVSIAYILISVTHAIWASRRPRPPRKLSERIEPRIGGSPPTASQAARVSATAPPVVAAAVAAAFDDADFDDFLGFGLHGGEGFCNPSHSHNLHDHCLAGEHPCDGFDISFFPDHHDPFEHFHEPTHFEPVETFHSIDDGPVVHDIFDANWDTTSSWDSGTDWSTDTWSTSSSFDD